MSANLAPLHISFTKKCLFEDSRLLSMLPPMAIALRSELDIDDTLKYLLMR